jgi:D-sedoheptulose 7-phosphate isomerase
VGGPGSAADWADHVLVARTDDPCIAKEVFVTTYHILWELVHVLLESPGALR